MTPSTAPDPGLLTAEEFGLRPDPGYPEELVRGRIVPGVFEGPLHGVICGNVVFILGRYLDGHDIGHAICNNAGVITERNPDSVRGPDFAFYSYERLPTERLRADAPYGPEVPELVIEVRSPGNKTSDLTQKVTEYLRAGVTVVVVLDPDALTAQVFREDAPVRILSGDDVLTLPDILEGFQSPVSQFFT